MRFSGGHINPATRVVTVLHIQPQQLANAQAAAVQQLGNAVVSGLPDRVKLLGLLGHKTGQLHSFINPQCLGQRFGRFWSAHPFNRVAGNQAFTAQPGV